MMDDLTTMQLTHGAHDTREEGVCLLEAVAWLAGEPHSDAPTCASMVLSAYGLALNDTLLPSRTDLEPRLRDFAPRLVGTAGHPDLDQRAGLMAADWLIRVYVPAWLRLAGLTEHADALADGDPIRSWGSLPTTGLAAAWRAAWDAARSAAWDAAWDAASSVTYSAAYSAAESAAVGAVWSAAAEDALAPTVRSLQDSALDLYERMIALWEGGR
jgi:hypothetical protein